MDQLCLSLRLFSADINFFIGKNLGKLNKSIFVYSIAIFSKDKFLMYAIDSCFVYFSLIIV